MNSDPIIRLTQAQLEVDTRACGSEYYVHKPVAVRGNCRDNDPEDCPVAHLYNENGKWYFQVHEFAPGPGPGDFTEAHSSMSDAIDSILEYYFGAPERMMPAELIESNALNHTWEKLKKLPVREGSECRHSECSATHLVGSLYCPFHHYEQLYGHTPPGSP